MADWDHDDYNRAQRSDDPARRERDWRGGRDWREAGRDGGEPGRRFDLDRPPEPRAFRDERHQSHYSGRGERDDRGGGRDERATPYEAEPGPYRAGGAAGRGYGDGGDSAFGQQTRGSSDSGLGGYSGADVGGWGQPVQNAQWGQGGYAPLNQGLDYGQDGRTFGPQGYDQGRFGGSEARRGPYQDEHHHHYGRWRDSQLANHDRDYSRWRDEQARRYDEEYHSWRNERHSAFSKEFEGWRSGRGGQSSGATVGAPQGSVGPSSTVNPSERSVYGSAAGIAPVEGAIHGANPTLAKIAEGHEGHQHHHEANKDEADKDNARH